MAARHLRKADSGEASKRHAEQVCRTGMPNKVPRGMPNRLDIGMRHWSHIW